MDITKLDARIQKSKRLLEKSCEERLSAIRQFVGRHYGNQPAKKKMPTNMLEMAVTIYLRHLAARAPSCEVNTDIPSLRPMAANLELVVNQVVKESRLVTALRRAVMEAMFSIGVVKVGISSFSEDPKVGDEPFASVVQLDDYFFDMSARSWDEVQYEGNEYWMDVETIRGFYGIDLAEDDYNGLSSDGVEQAKAVELDESADPLYGRVLLRDVYLPSENKLVTYAVQSRRVLREMAWDGPLGSPYVRLCFSEVPGNLMPLPPVAVWQDMNELANFIFRKIANQAMSKKTIVAVQGGTDDEVARFKRAEDGEAVATNGAKVDSVSLGGVDTQLLATFIQVRDLYSIFAGNLDSLGGLSPQSDTAAQDKIISEAASTRIRAMAESVEEFANEILRRFAWYAWTDPVRVRKVRKYASKEFNIGVDVQWTPETRDGDFLDYNFSVAALSMQDDSPSVRLQKLTNAFNAFILPCLPYAQQEGYTISMKALAEYVAKNAGIPELTDMVTSMMIPPNERQPAAGGSAQPSYVSTKSPNSHRVYERVNRPSSTRQGRDATMMQILLGGNPQRDEKAALAAGRTIG